MRRRAWPDESRSVEAVASTDGIGAFARGTSGAWCENRSAMWLFRCQLPEVLVIIGGVT
jgi:hypothetical protein